MRSTSAIASIPTLPAELSFDIPSQLWMVIDHPKLGVADNTKVCLLVKVCISLVKT